MRNHQRWIRRWNVHLTGSTGCFNLSPSFPSLISFSVNCCKFIWEKPSIEWDLAKKESLNCTRVYLWHHNELITWFFEFCFLSSIIYFFPSFPTLQTIFSYGMYWMSKKKRKKRKRKLMVKEKQQSTATESKADASFRYSKSRFYYSGLYMKPLVP